jgi:hypothetical protein
MGKKDGRKFYVQLSSGEQFEVSELDFNNIQSRIVHGKTNGWYSQRGESMVGSRVDYKMAFKDVAIVYADGEERKDKTIKDPDSIDLDKRKPKEVGKVKAKKPTNKCPHNWNNSDDWIHVTTIVNGSNRYFKQCVHCGAKSQLIKKREVEVAQEKIGETLDTIPLVA